MEAEEINYLIPPNIKSFSGNWDEYEEELYDIFKDTVLNGGMIFSGSPVYSQRRPELKGKHHTFWHLVSTGAVEEERVPDMRRCERLGWIKWVVENSDSNPDITFWDSKRRRSNNVVIWYEKEQYAVVLARRNGYFLLKTAYLVFPRRAREFRREIAEYNKNK